MCLLLTNKLLVIRYHTILTNRGDREVVANPQKQTVWLTYTLAVDRESPEGAATNMMESLRRQWPRAAFPKTGGCGGAGPYAGRDERL